MRIFQKWRKALIIRLRNLLHTPLTKMHCQQTIQTPKTKRLSQKQSENTVSRGRNYMVHCKWKLNTIFHILDQQNTSAITDVYTARESQFDNIYSRNVRKGMLHSPANLLLRIYFNKISRQVFKPWGAEMFIRAKKIKKPLQQQETKV